MPAEALERQIADRLVSYFGSPDEILDTLTAADDTTIDREHLLSTAGKLAAGCDSQHVDWNVFRTFLNRVTVRVDAIELTLDRQAVRRALNVSVGDEKARFMLSIRARLYRTGHDLRLVVNNNPAGDEAGVVDKALVKLIARGRRWYGQLTTGQRSSLREIAQAESLDERYVARILYGSLLAPDIVEKVVQGRQPVGFTMKSLKRLPPLDWDEQRRLYSMPR